MKRNVSCTILKSTMSSTNVPVDTRENVVWQLQRRRLLVTLYSMPRTLFSFRFVQLFSYMIFYFKSCKHASCYVFFKDKLELNQAQPSGNKCVATDAPTCIWFSSLCIYTSFASKPRMIDVRKNGILIVNLTLCLSTETPFSLLNYHKQH